MKQVTTRIVRDTVNPEWNERVTFYLKKPDEDIVSSKPAQAR
jgi:hypothetical protein